MRARRPRPSEETALCVVSGFFPQGHPTLARPPRRGGLRTPVMRARASPRDIPARPRPLGYASGRNEMPRHPYGLARRTHRVRPSEKTAPRVISGFSPQGHPGLARPPCGGAGSARPQRRNWPRRSMSPLSHRAFVRPGCLCYAPARIRPVFTGAETAPLRGNRPVRCLWVFPARPSHLGSPPAKGRAPHARDESPGFIEACPPLGHRPQRLAQEGQGNTLGPHAALRSAHPEDISPRRQAPLPCSRNP